MKHIFHTLLYTILLSPLTGFSQSNNKTTDNQTIKNMQTPKMKIEIWSDVFCPFCYIGKRNFEHALDSLGNAENIEIVWKSYQIAPTAKFEAGLDMNTALAKHLGTSPAQAKQMNENVSNMAKSSGLNYDLENAVWANTFDAHRLIQYAKQVGLSNEAEEHFFKAVFEEGKNIGDHTTLIALSMEIGLDKIAVEKVLNSTEFTEAVQKDMEEGQQLGIKGVPTFVIDRKSAFSGALPPAQMAKYLNSAYTEWAKDNPQGGICTPNGICK